MPEKEIVIPYIPEPFRTAPLVYFVRSRDAIKIGKSSRFGLRFSAIQSANPEPLLILGAIVCVSGAAALALEQTLHQKFAGLRIHGEWYRAHISLLRFIGYKCVPVPTVPGGSSEAKKRKPLTEPPPPPSLPVLLTPEEISEQTGIPVVRIRRLAKNRSIPAIKVGSQWRFQSDIFRALDTVVS